MDLAGSGKALPVCRNFLLILQIYMFVNDKFLFCVISTVETK